MKAALQIQTREEAAKFLSDYAQIIVEMRVKQGEDVTATQALEIARQNLSRMAIHEDQGVLDRVMKLFDAPPPDVSYFTGGVL